MYMEAVAALAGLAAGASAVYVRQRRCRERELEEIAGLTEKILNGQRIEASSSGEETLYAKIENRLVRVQESMQGRTDAAERSRDEIKRLISEIAHQMRTPLANVETYLGLMLDGLTEEDLTEETAAEYADAMKRSAEKLHFLAENFIKMSRLEHHIIQIRKEDADILRIVRNALGQIHSQAEEKGIAFEVTLPGAAACLHDPNWLGEAVYNLLDNAVKYSLPDGRVEVTVSVNEMFLKIQVRDFGIGIEPGEENALFQRFYRGKRVTDQEGFGIGLYLAREIVNLHGGFIAVRRMREGIMMEIDLPVGNLF